MIERNGGLMSVIVKGMKMPKNCLHCDFDDSYGICACRNEAPYVCEYSAKQRPSWCPLEVNELPSAQPDLSEYSDKLWKAAYERGKAEAQQRWIPCSERLPELDEDGYSDKVLVCFSNFTGCEVCEYRECDDCHGWYVGDSDDNPEDVGVHVIAWMPLPEPYREEGEADEND